MIYDLISYTLLLSAVLLLALWQARLIGRRQPGDRLFKLNVRQLKASSAAEQQCCTSGAEDSKQASRDDTVTPVYLRNVNVTRLDVSELPDAGNDAIAESARASVSHSLTASVVQSLDAVPLTETMRLRASLNRERHRRRLIERKLSEAQAMVSSLEDQILTQHAQRESLESSLSRSRQRLVKTRIELRRSHASRAEALSTANKSVALARQSVRARAHLETELTQLRKSLSDRRDTISTLLRTLGNRQGIEPLSGTSQTDTVSESAGP